MLVVQPFLALVVGLDLLEVDLGQTQATLRRTELPHIGDDFQLRDDIVRLYLLPRLLVEFGDDTVDLRLDSHFVTRPDFARNQRRALNIPGNHLDFLELLLFRLRFFEKEHKRADKHNGNQGENDVFQNLFHNIDVLFHF